MTESELKLLRKYCAHVLTDYGFDFSPDDPIVPSLYTIHRELNANKEGNKALAKSVQDALTKINPTVYNFNNRGEALLFKIGELIKWVVIGTGTIIIIWICNFWWRQHHDVERARNIIDGSAAITKILHENIRKNDQGYLYIPFEKHFGDSINFFSEYEEFKDGSVRVYIGKQD